MDIKPGAFTQSCNRNGVLVQELADPFVTARREGRLIRPALYLFAAMFVYFLREALFGITA